MAENAPQEGAEARAPPGTSDNSGLRMKITIINIINFLLVLIAWAVLAALAIRGGNISFFLFAAVTPWLILLVHLILVLTKVTDKAPKVINIIMLIVCILFALLVFVGSCLMAKEAADWASASPYLCSYAGIDCSSSTAPKYAAASAFGFFTTIGFIIQAIFHFQAYRST